MILPKAAIVMAVKKPLSIQVISGLVILATIADNVACHSHTLNRLWLRTTFL